MTFALFGFNQERFIREAIDGAFSQSYSPLEIILSDDCSHDGTFQIMQDMANRYQGSHRLILNRNMTNLGIARHVNRIFELAHGQLIIFAAGDDISLPERVQANYEAWEISNRTSPCIFSGFYTINKEGQPVKYERFNYKCNETVRFTEQKYSVLDFINGKKPLIVGGAAAWSPRIVEVFGPLPENIVHEDEVLACRTAYLGSFTYIASQLIRYRLHDKNIHGRYEIVATSMDELNKEEAMNQRWLVNRYKTYEAFIVDMETARKKSLIHQSWLEQSFSECRKKQKLLKMELDFYSSSFITKCRLLFQLKELGFPFLKLRSMCIRLLPVVIYRYLKLKKKLISANLQPASTKIQDDSRS